MKVFFNFRLDVTFCLLDRRSDEDSEVVHIVGEVKKTAFIAVGVIGIFNLNFS